MCDLISTYLWVPQTSFQFYSIVVREYTLHDFNPFKYVGVCFMGKDMALPYPICWCPSVCPWVGSGLLSWCPFIVFLQVSSSLSPERLAWEEGGKQPCISFWYRDRWFRLLSPFQSPRAEASYILLCYTCWYGSLVTVCCERAAMGPTPHCLLLFPSLACVTSVFGLSVVSTDVTSTSTQVSPFPWPTYGIFYL